MFSDNILLQFRDTLVKIIYIMMIMIFLSCIFLGTMSNKVYAAQYTEKYSSSALKSYPGYSDLIEKLKKAHPNWTFTMLYTGLDWNQVIKNETTALHGRNLIEGSKTGEWVCSYCDDDKYDNGSWKCASEATVAYYMDPRNSLYEDYIFQFENLKWVDGVYTVAGVNKIISDCKYMQGNKITYTKTNGKTGTINKSYAQVIYDAAKKYKISPYHLAARIRQEQGPGNNASSTATGKYSSYNGYYNFFNINAYGSGSSTIIKNALKYAKNQGWTDPEKSITGGAKFVADEYITQGQSTLYLQKFDVDNSDGSLYWHQYMQNVSASKTEGSTILKTYKGIDSKLSGSFNFVIPVYNNMPDTKCPQPGSQSIVTQDIQITSSSVIVRSSKSTTASKVATLSKNTKLLRIEIGNTKSNGYYWDKVVLSNGKKGYIISEGFKILDDITNCNVKAVATTDVNVRNGPGTSGTTVITTLSAGQIVTIVEKNKYKKIDGENWVRVYLSDGRAGYVAEEYVDEVSNSTGTTAKGTEIVKVICDSGLSIREEPGTSKKILKYADKGDYLTRTAKEVSNANGYVWDKVITDDGIDGYVARGDSKEDYIEVVKSNVSVTQVKGSGFKSSGTALVCEPKITVENIKKVESDAVVKNASGKEVKSGNVGTGYTVKIDGKTYTIRKLGDATGDGKASSADYVRIKNYLRKKASLNSNQKYAADVTGDGKVTSADYVRVKNYLRNKAKINI